MKRLLVIVTLFTCQLNASERLSRQYDGLDKNFTEQCTLFTYPNYVDQWKPYWLECPQGNLKVNGRQWKIVDVAERRVQPCRVHYNVTVESARTGLRPYFIKEGGASGILTMSYDFSLVVNTTWDWQQNYLLETKVGTINRLSELSLTTLPKQTLTLLGKSFISATVVGLGTAAYYANKHNRLTRNVSVGAILQEQNDRAQLPENQCSQITV